MVNINIFYHVLAEHEQILADFQACPTEDIIAECSACTPVQLKRN